jgi:hypothetical protein
MSHESRLMFFRYLSYNLRVVELTLTNVVIADCIRVDLISWAVFSHEIATIVATEVKDDFYYDRFLCFSF